MPNRHRFVLSLAAMISLALLAFVALLTVPLYSAQAAHLVPTNQVEQQDTITNTTLMMGDMMSMTADLMSMMSMMENKPLTGTLPGATGHSRRTLSLSLMGSMLEMMGLMHEMSAPCPDQMSSMPIPGSMPMLGNSGRMTGTMPMAGSAGNGAMLRMMGHMLQAMAAMQEMTGEDMMDEDMMDAMATMTDTMPMMGNTAAMMAYMQAMMSQMHASMIPCYGDNMGATTSVTGTMPMMNDMSGPMMGMMEQMMFMMHGIHDRGTTGTSDDHDAHHEGGDTDTGGGNSSDD